MRIRASAGVLLVLHSAAVGCSSHYRNVLPVRESSTVHADLAVAGVFDSRAGDGSAPGLIAEPTRLLAEKSGGRDVSGELGPGDASLLLSSSAQFQARGAELVAVRERVGHRYALVGALASAPVDESKTWIVELVIPLFYVLLFIPLPIRYSETPHVPHAALALRVIDLEQGRVLSESFEVMNDPASKGRFGADELSRGLAAMVPEEQGDQGTR